MFFLQKKKCQVEFVGSEKFRGQTNQTTEKNGHFILCILKFYMTSVLLWRRHSVGILPTAGQ